MFEVIEHEGHGAPAREVADVIDLAEVDAPDAQLHDPELGRAPAMEA